MEVDDWVFLPVYLSEAFFCFLGLLEHAISTLRTASPLQHSGHVRVYAWNSTSAQYTQRGSDIDGEAADDGSGSVSLSADGKVLAIGARYNDGKNGTDSGHVCVYAWGN
jgi:hypothetical protein